MPTRAEIASYSKEMDARTLEDAARIIKRRSKKPGGIALAAFCRVLTDTADELRREAAELESA